MNTIFRYATSSLIGGFTSLTGVQILGLNNPLAMISGLVTGVAIDTLFRFESYVIRGMIAVSAFPLSAGTVYFVKRAWGEEALYLRELDVTLGEFAVGAFWISGLFSAIAVSCGVLASIYRRCSYRTPTPEQVPLLNNVQVVIVFMGPPAA